MPPERSTKPAQKTQLNTPQGISAFSAACKKLVVFQVKVKIVITGILFTLFRKHSLYGCRF